MNVIMILFFVFNCIIAFSVYQILTEKGYSSGGSAFLSILAIFGGIIWLIIILALPEKEVGYTATIPDLSEWKCPNCFKMNSNIFKRCDCGYVKTEEPKVKGMSKYDEQ